LIEVTASSAGCEGSVAVVAEAVEHE
jgi:hypothetical protein